jgi:hypothetical protein
MMNDISVHHYCCCEMSPCTILFCDIAFMWFCFEISLSHDFVLRYLLRAILFWDITLVRFCSEISPACDFVLRYHLSVILFWDIAFMQVLRLHAILFGGVTFVQFCYAISLLCNYVYMNCLNTIAKAALVSWQLLDFWFVALMDLLRLDQKNVTLAFSRLVGKDGFVWRLSVAFERLHHVWVCFSRALSLFCVITGLSIRIKRHCPRLQLLVRRS